MRNKTYKQLALEEREKIYQLKEKAGKIYRLFNLSGRVLAGW